MLVAIIEYDTKTGDKQPLVITSMKIIPNAHDYIKLYGVTYSVISRCFDAETVELVVYKAD